MGPRDERLERLLRVDESLSRGEIGVKMQFNVNQVRLKLLGKCWPHEKVAHILRSLEDEGVVSPDEIFGFAVDLLADPGEREADGNRERGGSSIGVAALDF